LPFESFGVEPDLRVETQTPFRWVTPHGPCGQGRSTSRGRHFSLSFVPAPGFDVEAISGSVLSHWTELKTGESRSHHLDLAEKTKANSSCHQPRWSGVKATNNWSVQNCISGAANRRGTLLVVPEQGMRLTPRISESLTN